MNDDWIASLPDQPSRLPGCRECLRVEYRISKGSVSILLTSTYTSTFWEITLVRTARPTLRSIEEADMAVKPKKVQTTTALPAVPLLLPKVVVLRQDEVGAVVSWPAREIAAKAHSSSEGCLTAFLELARASDEQVAEFATVWGVLLLETFQRRYKVDEQFSPDASAVTASDRDIDVNMICQSPGFVKFFGESPEQGNNVARAGEYQWKVRPVAWDCEPTGVYRRYATQARALLHIAAKLSIEQLADLEWWQRAISPDAPEEFQWPVSEDFKKHCQPQRDLDVQRHLLGLLVTGWIEKGSLRPQFMWSQQDEPHVVLNVNLRYEGYDPARVLNLWYSESALFHAEQTVRHSPTMPLFNVLTLQLLAMLTSRNGLHVCDAEGCTTIYAPKDRKVRSDRNGYCSDECTEKAKRKRSRDFNRKKRAA